MVQWYPGHMAKALREMEEKVKLVDLVMVLLDARIPSSSLNPKLKAMFNNKKILYLRQNKKNCPYRKMHLLSVWLVVSARRKPLISL